MTEVSRRDFLIAGGVAATQLFSPYELLSASVSPGKRASFQISEDSLRQRISRSDLVYCEPVSRSEEGIPIGNGRMGTLVWTTPSRLRMQINRVDVYASNASSNSFIEPHNDYCGGCAFLDIDFGEAIFSQSGCRQHLQIFDGRLLVDAANLTLEVYPVFSHDVLAISISDRRTDRQPITASLRSLRYDPKYVGFQLEVNAREYASTLQTRDQTARTRVMAGDGFITLTQEFREAAYFCSSAVAAKFVGAHGESEIVNETAVQLRTADQSSCRILVGSAASFDQHVDIAAASRTQIDAVTGIDPTSLKSESESWWHAFWQRGSLELRSSDGTAEFIQSNYHYFLYLMASTSQGKFPPKFNGMLWNTGGDFRMWGAQHWWTNLSCYYEALPASGRFDLMDPVFDMYTNMFEACSTAAHQEWGSQGIYIAETVYFDGLERLPESIASEMQELYLQRKPWEQRSAAFMAYASTKHPYSSVWNWEGVGHWKQGRYIVPERGDGPYGPTSHWITATAKVAYLFWRRYEYTQDEQWLRLRAYPMLRGAVEFYRCHPNVKKGSDGKYHIHGVNNGEAVRGATDTTEDIAAMRATTAALIRAAELLQLDSQTLPAWREFFANIAPLPTSDNRDAIGAENYKGPRIFVSGLKPVVRPGTSAVIQDINSLPTWFFDLSNVETSDRGMVDLAQATLDELLRVNPQDSENPGGLSKVGVAAASLGRTDAAKKFIPRQMNASPSTNSSSYKKSAVLRNRMNLLEGTQALAAEHLGRASEALHMALLQSNPPSPAGQPIIHVFPAWPKEWDASYTLFARGGFTVTASMENGEVKSVALYSSAGSPCRLRNPYSKTVQLYRDGRRAETLSGSLLEFKTTSGEDIEVKPQQAAE